MTKTGATEERLGIVEKRGFNLENAMGGQETSKGWGGQGGGPSDRQVERESSKLDGMGQVVFWNTLESSTKTINMEKESRPQADEMLEQSQLRETYRGG